MFLLRRGRRAWRAWRAARSMPSGGGRLLFGAIGRAVWNQDGSVDCTWKRRSRLDLGWVGNVDQAQFEQQESYRVALYANGMSVREWVIGENILRVSAQEIVEANVPQNDSLWFSVRQIGRFAESAPLLFSAD